MSVLYVYSEKFMKLQKKSVVGFFGESSWPTASKFAEVEAQDKCLPWNH